MAPASFEASEKTSPLDGMPASGLDFERCEGLAG